MADLTGRLDINLQRGDADLAVSIRSSRATAASRVFVGKTVTDTTKDLPALFSICANAQACACTSACEAALGLTASPTVVQLRRLLVDAETVKEHLWRMLLDWPRFVQEPPLEGVLAKVMAASLSLRALLTASTGLLQPGANAVVSDVSAVADILDELARLSADHVFGGRPSRWLARMQTGEDLLSWAESSDTAPARLVAQVHAKNWASAGRNSVTALPRLTAADLDRPLSSADADGFVAEPSWQNDPRESSPFTRQLPRAPVSALVREHGNGLLPRLAAQLVELASLQQNLRGDVKHLDDSVEPLAVATRDGVGIAQVSAARGLLVHRVAVDQDRICDYRILAPTEWNFHPGGVVVQGLSRLQWTDAETLRQQAALFVTAVDPCVDYHLTVS